MPVTIGFKGTNALMNGPPLCSPSWGGQGITSCTADSIGVGISGNITMRFDPVVSNLIQILDLVKRKRAHRFQSLAPVSCVPLKYEA